MSEVEKLHWQQMSTLIGGQIDEFRKINSGIHISLLGTTRGGKTTLVLGGNSRNGILSNFENALIIDSTGDPGYIKDYGKPVKKFGSIEGHRRLSIEGNTQANREKIHKYVSKAIQQKHIAIFADEFRQLSDKKFLNLAPLFEHIYLFCAKHDVSLIAGTQAPRWVSSAFYDQSKMQFIFGIRDRRARRRLGEIGGGDMDVLDPIVANLPRFHFAHVDIFGDVRVSKYAAPIRSNKRKVKSESENNSLDNGRRVRVRLTQQSTGSKGESMK